MKRFLFFIWIAFIPVLLSAQDETLHESDSIQVEEAYITFDESFNADSVVREIEATKARFKPDPNKAILYSAILPGLGQIYNKKYWKLPIVYGGFLGCIYAMTWNGSQYRGYLDAFNDFSNATNNKPGGNSWQSYVPYTVQRQIGDWTNIDNWSANQKTWFTNALKTKKDYYRHYRDMTYFITAGLYALCIIDAYVDAQLFDFDISENLSLKVDPIITPQTNYTPRTFGLQCSFTF